MEKSATETEVKPKQFSEVKEKSNATINKVQAPTAATSTTNTAAEVVAAVEATAAAKDVLQAGKNLEATVNSEIIDLTHRLKRGKS